jgi:ankyrin repeat protein
MAVILSQLLQVCPKTFGDRPDSYEWAPLHVLASFQDPYDVKPGMIATLCRHGAQVDCTRGDLKETPLMLAIRAGNTDAAEVLMRYNADIDKENGRGASSLSMAKRDKDLENWVELFAYPHSRTTVDKHDRLLIQT